MILRLALCTAMPGTLGPATALAEPKGSALIKAPVLMVDRVVAQVNDEVVLWSDLTARARPFIPQMLELPRGPVRDREAAAMYRKLLDDAIHEKLFKFKVRALKLEATKAEIDSAIGDVRKANKMTQEQLEAALNAQGMTWSEYRAKVRDQIERSKIIGAKIRNRVRITDEDLKARYARDTAAMAGGDELQLRHILVKVAPGAPPEADDAARAKATQTLERLRGGEDFAVVAAAISDDPARETGGLLGWLKKGEFLKELEDAAAPLKPGEIAGPVRTAYGYHLVRVEGRRRAGVKPFGEVSEKLRQQVYDEQIEKLIHDYEQELRREAHVVDLLDKGPLTLDDPLASIHLLGPGAPKVPTPGPGAP